MSIISIIAFIVAAHSVIMILVLVVNPDWYVSKAISAGVTPNISAAITTKVIIAGVAFAVGIYSL
ncbi:hypothetical protein O5O45_00130 [Hahella aquimaris]|uniref:hypothetical protein n=1 Tax=Hahella sp. HNIBRBA332 TaxID=3015983 RepID=UPI00273C06FC|nr:hypothetical protein [Hahella sp. HNIBRBA332]WLQ14347.1 hypothetical protein O5O45_00130 [Hahella sp. HNIBRBA332]